MRQHWEFGAPPRILFGRGVVQRLETLLAELGVGRVAVVTDRTLLQLDAIAAVVAAIGERFRCCVFAGGEPEPSLALVETARRTVEEELPQVDAVVAIGGGSNIDIAKGVAVLLRHGGAIEDYLGEDRIPGATVPLLTVSTTAGTGSEVSGVAVLNDPARSTKIGLSSAFLRPQLAVFDPLLTLSCPPVVTAHAGIDALTHAIEAYVAIDFSSLQVPADARITYQGKNPYSDALALEAISLIGGSLRDAVLNGRNVQAREDVHLGSLLAGLAFSNAGLGAVHALQLPVGAATGTSHGLGNGILLPYVMDFNLPVRLGEYRRVAQALGERVGSLSLEEGARRAVLAVTRLRRDIGIPATLEALGLTEARLPQLADTVMATQERLLRYNPRVMHREDAQGVLENALRGRYSFS